MSHYLFSISAAGKLDTTNLCEKSIENLRQSIIDGLIKSQNWDGKVKSSRCKARKS
jgi:hypothetical protein